MSTLVTSAIAPEILDLRHFSSPALRPLLEQEVQLWEDRLLWDYSRSIELLLEFVDSRSLTGYVAVQNSRAVGYAFGVCEATKAVLGDLYAFGEAQARDNRLCALLLRPLLETLQSTPGIHRVEAQLLLFPGGSLHDIYTDFGFRRFPRCYMVRHLDADLPTMPPPQGRWRLETWQPAAYVAAATLIHTAYVGHTDSDINDQYRTVVGAQRFLHNIVHFPGCGVFDPHNSLLLRDIRTGALTALLLCSRVRCDTAHITQLCVAPDLHGLGLGKTLLFQALAQLRRSGIRSVSLTVTASNEVAQHLYREAGFQLSQSFDAWVWDRQISRYQQERHP